MKGNLVSFARSQIADIIFTNIMLNADKRLEYIDEKNRQVNIDRKILNSQRCNT